MPIIRITLYDFDVKTEEPKDPLHVEMEYDPDLSLEEQGIQKVSIYVGDNVTGGNVLIPLAMLNECMTTVAMMAVKRDQGSSSIILPPKPKLVI